MDSLVAALKRLPPDTPITSGQLAELLDAVLSHARQSAPSNSHDFASLPDNHELTQVELSAWLRKAQSTIEKRRAKGTGPAYKPGKPVLYKVGDVKAWLANRRVNSTSEATVRGIHRLETLADLFPVFTFENILPMGLEDAFDYQVENPEALPTSLVFHNLKNILNVQNPDEQHVKEEVLQPMDVVFIFINAENRLSRQEETFSDFFEQLVYLKNKGIGINDIALQNGGNLAHVFAKSGHLLNNDSEIIKALEYFESLGLDLEAKNKEGKTPPEVAPPDSNVKDWLNAQAEHKMLHSQSTKVSKEKTTKNRWL